jgi:hypothetical protein
MVGDSSVDTAAFIGGGRDNSVTSPYTTIGGGYLNEANEICATVSGGRSNVASDSSATVGGGSYNMASRAYATVAGGYNNTASGTIYGGFTTVGGGRENEASLQYATVAGGRTNAASGYASAVGGGQDNTAGLGYATVAGGYNNNASAFHSTVAGGRYNTASDTCATVCGGEHNIASGKWATVAGGAYDTSSAWYAFSANYTSVASHSSSAAFNGQATTGSGQVRVGTISKASGSFTIDHPLDPMNKILNHYFIESPEMVNIYRGEVVLDAEGRAEVYLPDYFSELNRTPMVHLTGVGSANFFVAEEVRGNHFTIGGDPGMKVYWIVTGDRKDPSAEITRIIIPVEQLKEGALAGRSLDDDFLAVTRAQLEEMGRAGEFEFRTSAGRAKYERSIQPPSEVGSDSRE